MARVLILLAALLWAPLALAQDGGASIDDDDGGRGYLTGLLEGLLSSDDTSVRIDGFEGALSTRATIGRIRIADGQGVWLTLEGLVFDWDRSALFSRELVIQELSAERVVLERMPVSSRAPEATSTDFSFPELPVAVEINRVGIGELVLGEAILEGGATLTAEGSVALDGGDGRVSLSARRTDGRRGVLTVQAVLDQEAGTLGVDARFDEGEGGIAASALGIPGEPSVVLTVSGAGPLDDFEAQVLLQTDGTERLSGTVGLTTLGDAEDDTSAAQRFVAELSGDLAPLFAPQYQDFFGEAVTLRLIAERLADGAIRLEDLTVEAAAISLTGTARIAADRLPEAFDLRLRIADPGEPVLLPLPTEVFVRGADLEATFNEADGERWTLDGTLSGVTTPSLDMERLVIDGGGTISRGATRAVTAQIESSATGLRPADPGLALALGRDVSFDAALSWEDGAPVTFERFELSGDGYELAGDGQFLLANLAVVGVAEASVDDISRLSTLAGRSLGGSLAASLEGRADILGGGFDIRLTGQGRDLTTGIETADALLGGMADLVIDAVRNTEGTRIRLVSVETEALSAEVTGLYAPASSDLTFEAELDDLGRVLPQLSGPVTLAGTARGRGDRWTVGLEADAPSGSRATVFAVIPEDGAVSVDLDASIEDVTPFVPQLSGPGTVTASIDRIDGGWSVDADLDVVPGVSAQVSGAFVTDGIGQAEYAARIEDLSVFDPNLAGALNFEGTATTEAGGIVARAELAGPGGLAGTVSVLRPQIPDATEGEPAAPISVTFDLSVDEPEAVYPLPEELRVPGPVAATGTLELGRTRRLDVTLDGPYGIAARIGGEIPEGAEALEGLAARFEVTAPDAALLPYVPEELTGEARARGEVRVEGGVRRATLDLDGPAGIEADLSARMQGADITADYDLRAADVSRLPYVPEGIGGPARARGTASVEDGLRRVMLDLDGPAGIEADVTASLPEGGGLMGLAAEFDIAIADLAALPGVPPEAGGRATATGMLSQGEDGRSLDARLTAPLGIEAEVTASQPSDAMGLEGLVADLDLTTGDLSALLGVPDAGAARAEGQITVEGDIRRISFEMDGPIGLAARVDAQLPAGSSIEGLDGTFSASLPALERLPGLPDGLDGPAAIAGAVSVEDGILRADASVDGPVTGEIELSRALDARGLAGLDLTFDLDAPDLAAFPGVPDALAGPASAAGRIEQGEEARTITARIEAPLGITARIDAEQPGDAAGLDGLTASLDLSTDDLSPLLGLPDGVAGGATATGRLVAGEDGRRLTLDVDAPFGVTANIDADLPMEGMDGLRATYEAIIPEIGALPGVPEGFGGRSELRGSVESADGGTRVVALVDGPYGLDGEVTADLAGGLDGAEIVYDLLLPDLAAIPGVPPELSGPARIDGTAQREEATWTTDFALTGPAGADLEGAAVIEAGTVLAGLSGTVASPSAINPAIPGPITLEASARVVDGDLSAEIMAEAPDDTMLRATASIPRTGEARIDFEANLGRPEEFVPQLRGPLTAEGSARRQNGTWTLDADVVTGGGSSALVNASLAPGGDADVSADVRLGDLGRFVKQFPGALTARIDARRRGGTWVADIRADGPGLSGTTRVTLPPSGEISGTFDVRLERLERLDDRLAGTGAVSARGTLAQAGDRIVVSAGIRGPATLDARVSGSLARDFRSADLRARGTAPLGLANPFIPPRLVNGDAQFDLALNGPIALRSLRGTIRTSGARLALPKFRTALEGIVGTIRLTGTRAELDISGSAISGGTFALNGDVQIAPNLPAQISLELNGIGIRDPLLYETTADARLRVTGPLLNGGGMVSGDVQLARTEIRIPGRGFASTGAIPLIDHVAPPLDVRATLERARLDAAARAGDANRDGTPSRNFFVLDIRVNAERRIFIRGRGLDAELGGTVRLTGTTRAIRPSGSFALIRGRIDLLGRRLTLDEGSITLQGDFVPVVRLVASTRTDEGIVSLVVEGDLTSPQITFESETGLPQDEVVARLLFGQGLGSLTPLQAARLANAVAVLSGSGLSPAENIRERLGLDNLDVVIDDEGLFGVTAGKYVREDVYTSVTVDEEGETEVEIVIDLTDEIILRGSVNDDGETGIGFFFERDY